MSDFLPLMNELDLADRISGTPCDNCPYALFIGAGASVSSGILSAGAMVSGWRRQLYDHEMGPGTEEHREDWLKEPNGYAAWWKERGVLIAPENEYSSLFSHFRGTARERQHYIETLVDNKEPGFGYLYLAGLIKQGRFRTILTTNFDDLLHDALFRYYDVKPLSLAFDSAVGSVATHGPRPKIFKLHGDFLYDNLKNVGQEVVRLGAQMEEKITHACREVGLVVVGYNGNDTSVMVPLQNMIRSETHLKEGLHWCVLCDGKSTEEAYQMIPRRVRELRRDYPGRVFLYQISGFDALMELIFTKCSCQPPGVFASPEKYSLLQRFREAITSTGQDPYLTTGMYDYLDKFYVAQEKGMSVLDARIARANSVFFKARGLRRRGGDLDAVMKEFDVSLELASDVLNSADATPKHRFRALRRQSGVFVEKAEIEGRRGNLAACQSLISLVLATVDNALVASADAGADLESAEKRACPYNGANAWAIKRHFFGALTDEELEQADHFYRELVALDPEGSDQADFAKELGAVQLIAAIEKWRDERSKKGKSRPGSESSKPETGNVNETAGE